MVGMPILKIEGAKGGEIVDIITTELVSKNGGDINGSSMLAPANRLVCPRGFANPSILQRVRNEIYHRPRQEQSRLDAENIALPYVERVSARRQGQIQDLQRLRQQDLGNLQTNAKNLRPRRLCGHPLPRTGAMVGRRRVQSWNTFFISATTASSAAAYAR